MSVSNPMYNIYNNLMKILGYDYQIKQFIFNHTDKNKLVTSILEVGCGTGITGLCLLKIFCHANLLLTDNNIKFIHTLEKKTSKENAISLGVSDISHPEKVTLLSGKYIQIKLSIFHYLELYGEKTTKM